MLPKAFFVCLLFTVAVFIPVVMANASDRYDMYSQCGAPFCGFTGGTAIAGAVASMDRNATAGALDDKHDEKPPKM
jgi:hypothetical protein